MQRFNMINFSRSVLGVKPLYLVRKFSAASENVKKGIVVGISSSEGHFSLTSDAQKLDASSGGRLQKLISLAGPEIKPGKGFIFYDVTQEATAVAVVGLGEVGKGVNQNEAIDDDKEGVRTAAAVGCLALKAADIRNICVESFGDACSAAEGALLSTWVFDEYKSKKDPPVKIEFFGEKESNDWNRGVIQAEAQNFARRLMESPSNLMTPTIFAKNVAGALSNYGVDVSAHNQEWIANKKMGAFLSVSKGSSEPPVFLEISYLNGPKNQSPVVLVGKGVTFDTGGISLKPAKGMPSMRGDMGGAACVVSAIQAAARLQLNINVKGLIPLCENMPGGSATKPGDIVIAMNGKSIQVDNTDAEGRLILADALCYADGFKPKFTIDVATLTGAMRVALGGAATGVFSNSTPLWEELQKASVVTGDRVWRFPLWDCYSKYMTDHKHVDLNNVGPETGGGSCTAAGFLREFAPKQNWMHLDIAGVMDANYKIKYLGKGMTGRPTRTIIELLAQSSAK